MYKQSTYVLALFLGTASATQLTNSFATGMNGDEDLGEDITMKGNKFHFVQQKGANGCGQGELMTAGGNCLFETNAIQLNADPAAEPTAGVTAKTSAANYPEPEKVHTLDPKIAKAHTTFYNGKQTHPVSDSIPINSEVMDGYVYDHAISSSESIPHKKAADPPVVQSLSQRSGRDISEKKIDEDVQDFANKHVERLAWPRSEEAFVPNGSKVTFPAADPVANPYVLNQRRGMDISEKNIDEDVQDFANKHVERLAWPRSEAAFVPNGSKVTFPAADPVANPYTLYQRFRNEKDISESNIDAEVHGLANSNVDRMPWARSERPFVMNGSESKFQDRSGKLYQRNGRDISEKNIDEEVQGMANTMVDRLNWPRSEEPFVPNGSQMTFPPSLYQRRRNGRDISEKNIDEEVQGMANTMVDRLNWPRSEEPFVPNGSQVTFPAASLYQHHKNAQDIANKEVRPDVWVTVHKMVDPVAHWRGNKAPKSTYEDWWGEGPPPMQELEKPKCPEELEEPEHPMAKKLKKQAKKAKAKKEKEDAEMPGDIEEKKEEKKDDAKDEKKGDAKDAKDEKKDEKEEDSKDEKKEDAKEEKKEEKLHQHTPPKSSLIYDEQNNLWRTEY